MPTLKEILDSRFGGVITHDMHQESDEAVCALELLSVKKGIPFTDHPHKVRCFDFRFINDMRVPDWLRTEHMLLMLEAYEDSMDWEKAKKRRVLERIIISTVNQLLVNFPGLHESLVAKCKAAKTLEAALWITKVLNDGSLSLYFDETARRIAEAASYVLSGRYEDAAAIASLAAVHTAAACYDDACNDARNATFIKTCKIWLEAAKD